jgi:hypothetical protein
VERLTCPAQQKTVPIGAVFLNPWRKLKEIKGKEMPSVFFCSDDLLLCFLLMSFLLLVGLSRQQGILLYEAGDALGSGIHSCEGKHFTDSHHHIQSFQRNQENSKTLPCPG